MSTIIAWAAACVLSRSLGKSTAMAMLPSSTGDAIQGKRLPKWGSSCAFSVSARKSMTASSPSVLRNSRSAALARPGLPLRKSLPSRSRRPFAPVRPPRSRALCTLSSARRRRPVASGLSAGFELGMGQVPWSLRLADDRITVPRARQVAGYPSLPSKPINWCFCAGLSCALMRASCAWTAWVISASTVSPAWVIASEYARLSCSASCRST
ncbi:hypothetical protein G6F31_018441 [Rhizopus arrhizus]|nr:hypothetical protein G6F31_018441 [Rhizopus arrhizus]